jgi:hypothetical protein
MKTIPARPSAEVSLAPEAAKAWVPVTNSDAAAADRSFMIISFPFSGFQTTEDSFYRLAYLISIDRAIWILIFLME